MDAQAMFSYSSRNPTLAPSRNYPALLSGRPRGFYPRNGGIWRSKCLLGLSQSRTWLANMGRVDLGGCPPRPPTDPDVRVKRIWLFVS